MILIVSQENEFSTDQVMDWLYYLGEDCIRLNSENYLLNRSLFSLELNNDLALVRQNFSENAFDPDDLKAIWFRRPSFASMPNSLLEDLRYESFYLDLQRNLFGEYTDGTNAFLMHLTPEKRTLGDFRKCELNKIEILSQAKNLGIDIPATIITNSKAELRHFKERYKNIITKSIKDTCQLTRKGETTASSFLNYTEAITDEILDRIPDLFFHSLFQEKLDKDLEIRVFYLNGTCYPMAIFSQTTEQTSIDFRKYAGNRNVPFNLPEELDARIVRLMAQAGLNTGSIDIVKTKDKRYVFLEINPIGQYDMTSVPCNYHLDKKIAEYLSGKAYGNN